MTSPHLAVASSACATAVGGLAVAPGAGMLVIVAGAGVMAAAGDGLLFLPAIALVTRAMSLTVLAARRGGDRDGTPAFKDSPFVLCFAGLTVTGWTVSGLIIDSLR